MANTRFHRDASLPYLQDHIHRVDIAILVISIVTLPIAIIGGINVSNNSVPSDNVANAIILAWLLPGPFVGIIFSCVCLYRSRHRIRPFKHNPNPSLPSQPSPYAWKPLPMLLMSLAFVLLFALQIGLTITCLIGGLGNYNQENTTSDMHTAWVVGRVLLITTVCLFVVDVLLFALHTIRAIVEVRENRLEVQHAWTALDHGPDEPQRSPLSGAWRYSGSSGGYERARSISNPSRPSRDTLDAYKVQDDGSSSPKRSSARHSFGRNNTAGRQNMLREYYSVNRESLNRESALYMGGESQLHGIEEVLASSSGRLEAHEDQSRV